MGFSAICDASISHVIDTLTIYGSKLYISSILTRISRKLRPDRHYLVSQLFVKKAVLVAHLYCKFFIGSKNGSSYALFVERCESFIDFIALWQLLNDSTNYKINAFHLYSH